MRNMCVKQEMGGVPCSISGGGSVVIAIVSYWVPHRTYSTVHAITLPTCKPQPSSLPVTSSIKFTKGLHMSKTPKPTPKLKTKAPTYLRHLNLSNPTQLPLQPRPKKQTTQKIISSVQLRLYYMYIPPHTSSSIHIAQAAMVLPAAVSRAASSATSCPDLAGLDVPPRSARWWAAGCSGEEG
jgi:hypothetical protein